MTARRNAGQRREAAEPVRETGDVALALHLARGESVAAAAGAAGMSELSAYRRLEDEAFRRRVSELRSEMLDRAVGKLADAATEAAQTLRDLLGADSETGRLGAARAGAGSVAGSA